MNRIIHIIWSNLELVIWTGALAFLFAVIPSDMHFTLCPISNFGFNYCPGCGLGHAIHYAMRLDFQTSFFYHHLGIPGLIIIIHRIFILIVKLFKTYNYEQFAITTHTRN
jgi:hypothetical protein